LSSIVIYKDNPTVGIQDGSRISENDFSNPVDSGFLIIPETGTEIGEWKKLSIRCNTGLQTINDLNRNCRLTLEGSKSDCWQLASDDVSGSPSSTPSDWGEPLDIVSDKIYDKNYIFHVRACADVGDIVENDKTTKLTAQALVGLPWVLDIDDMLAADNVGEVYSSIFTIPEDCIIYTLNVDAVNPGYVLKYIVNGVELTIGHMGDTTFNWIYQALSVSKNSTFQIYLHGVFANEAEGNLKLFLNNENGKELAFFYWHINQACYLTTACVNYKGLDDNCSELTAMRLLREHYIDDLDYRELIREYYQLASQIIESINAEDDPSLIYDQIYQSVKICEIAVNNGDWAIARDEYLSMYYELAETYVDGYVRLMIL